MQVAALQQGSSREPVPGERDEREPKEPAPKLPWKVGALETPGNPWKTPALALLNEAVISPTFPLLPPGC